MYTNKLPQIAHALLEGDDSFMVSSLKDHSVETLNKPIIGGKTFLAVATAMENEYVVEKLLEKGVSMNVLSESIFTDKFPAPFFAIKKHNIKFIEKFVQHGFDINSTSKDGYTLFHLALKEIFEEQSGKQIEFLKTLVEMGADPKINAGNLESSLMVFLSDFDVTFEVEEEDVEVVKYLIEQGVDINFGYDKEDNIASYMASVDNKEMADLILKKASTELINSFTKDEGYDNLQWALEFKNKTYAKALLETGLVDLNHVNANGETSIEMARRLNMNDIESIIEKQ